MVLGLIKENEIQVAFEILQDGVNTLKSQGIDQWQKGYPNIEAIQNDYHNKTGYLLKDQDEIVAYVSITTDKETLYEAIDSWNCKHDYAIVHRVAIKNKHLNKGYSKILFDEIKNTCISLGIQCIRIDTHPQNKNMIHVIERNGYKRITEMMYPEGLRIAFENCL